jgi:hypothetical protein
MPKQGIDFAAMPQTAIKVITGPAAFFREMPRSGGFGEPLLFLMVMSAVTGLLQALLLLFGLAPDVQMSVTVAILSIILYPLVAAVAGFIIAAVLFVIWKVIGSQESYETAYRCMAYVGALFPITAVLGAIPYAGGVLGIALTTFFYVTASVETHKITAQKAWTVFGIIGVLLIAMNLGGELATRSAQQNNERLQQQIEDLKKKLEGR